MKYKKNLIIILIIVISLSLIYVLNIFIVTSITGNAIQTLMQEIDPKKSAVIDHEWNYNGEKWSLSFSIPDYSDFYKQRERKREYDLFASDPYDDKIINDLAYKLHALGKSRELSDKEIAYLVTSFVQSLPYTADNISNPSDEYPKFPYETLHDQGGDCEDTTFLASALLEKLGYHTALIIFNEDHNIGVGIDCVRGPQSYVFEFEGTNYCYLETTEKNWPVGRLPDDLIGSPAKIIPIRERPFLDLNFIGENYNAGKDELTNLNISVTNLGSATAKKVKIYVALKSIGPSRIYDSAESDYFTIEPEQKINYYVEALDAPEVNDIWRVYIEARGENTNTAKKISEWFTKDRELLRIFAEELERYK